MTGATDPGTRPETGDGRHDQDADARTGVVASIAPSEPMASPSTKSIAVQGKSSTAANSRFTNPSTAANVSDPGKRAASAFTEIRAITGARSPLTVASPTEGSNTVTAPMQPAVTSASSIPEPTPSPQVSQTPSTSTPSVLSGMAGFVSGVLKAVLSPLGAGSTPDAPAEESSLWSVLAFARRDLEEALTAPTTVPVTAQPPGATAQETLTYTPAPTVIDTLTDIGLRLVRVVSEVTDFNIEGNFGALISSDDPPGLLTYGLTAQQIQVGVSPGTDWDAWQFTPPDPSGKTVVAIAGGGFIQPPSLLQ
jgi:hypothetical protein